MSPSQPAAASQSMLTLTDDDRQAIQRMQALSPKADPLRWLPDVAPAVIPRHIAIIMDGNGRWAREQGFDRTFGHRHGAMAVRRTLESCAEIGIEVLTLYSFSSENWRRPAHEIEMLMRLCQVYMEGEREELLEQNIRLKILGRREGLPSEVLEAIDATVEATASCTGPTLCLALNYGSRDEIVDAVRSIARSVASGKVSPDEIDHEMISDSLYTAGLPDPDLLIRTAGQMRISNYLLWQISYAELHVTDSFWPDFDRDHLLTAIRDFASRRRRFGGLDADRAAEGASS